VNGTPTTLTKTTVVPAGQPDQTSAGGSTKPSVTGALQTNAANTGVFGMNVVLGAVGVAVFGGII